MDENLNGGSGPSGYTDPNAGYQYNDGRPDGFYNQGGTGGYDPRWYGQMDTSPMSLGDWLLTILALMIPCVGIILYFVWAFSKSGNINRRNYCRAMLIVEIVVILLSVIAVFVFGVSIFSAYSVY